MPHYRPTSTIPLSDRAMPTQQPRRRMSEGAETDEDIPALQSPSDSSDSDDDLPPQPRPTARQRTTLPRRPLANVFDSDDSETDITESGAVPSSFNSRAWRLTFSTPTPRCAVREGAATAIPRIHESISIYARSTSGQLHRHRHFQPIGGPIPLQFQRGRRRSGNQSRSEEEPKSEHNVVRANETPDHPTIRFLYQQPNAGRGRGSGTRPFEGVCRCRRAGTRVEGPFVALRDCEGGRSTTAASPVCCVLRPVGSRLLSRCGGSQLRGARPNGEQETIACSPVPRCLPRSCGLPMSTYFPLGLLASVVGPEDHLPHV
jgi:hypothetical protein